MVAGRLNPGGQTYQASGESTPSAELPDEFVSTVQPSNMLARTLVEPTGYLERNTAPIVNRAPRMVGMRYLYQRGMHRMPIQRLGADGQPYPWDSRFQPNFQGIIHDAGFNDALYQAGYPGFNLGLSFKVPTLPQNTETPAVGRTRPAGFTPVPLQGATAVRIKRSN